MRIKAVTLLITLENNKTYLCVNADEILNATQIKIQLLDAQLDMELAELKELIKEKQ